MRTHVRCALGSAQRPVNIRTVKVQACGEQVPGSSALVPPKGLLTCVDSGTIMGKLVTSLLSCIKWLKAPEYCIHPVVTPKCSCTR